MRVGWVAVFLLPEPPGDFREIFVFRV